MLSDRVIFANEKQEFDILGKDGQDNFVFKKIKLIEVIEKNNFEIISNQKIFRLSENYVIYGDRQINIKNLSVGDSVYNFTTLSYNPIKNKINVNEINLDKIKSYLYGFHNSVLTKISKYDLTFTGKISTHTSNIQFLDIAYDHYLEFSQQMNDSLLETIIKWHIENNIPSHISKSFGNYYEDKSHIARGIVRCSLPPHFLLDLACNTTFLYPSVFNYFNLKYFLIGFLLGMMWNGELYNYAGDKGLTWREGKGGSINTTKNISFIIHKNNLLLKFLSFVFSIFNFQYKYELSKEMNFVKVTLSTNNFQKLLGKNIPTDKVYSKIIRIEKKENTKMLKFEVETEESGWRPILDYTLVEID